MLCMFKLLSAQRWPFLVLGTSLAMLAAAHAFERFGGYTPCLLCLRQREVYWTAIGLALVVLAASRWKPALSGGGSAALALVFLYGAGLAAFHAGVEWRWWPGPAACAAGANSGALSADAVLGALSAPQRAPSCDTAPWRLAGVSMAGYNALISLALSSLGFVSARRMS